MHDLRPICNDCSGELIPDNLTGYSAWLLCPNCDKRYKMTDETALAHAETYFTNRANRKSEELKQKPKAKLNHMPNINYGQNFYFTLLSQKKRMRLINLHLCCNL